MRVIVAGSRTCKKYPIVKEAIELSGFKPTLIISGTATGADRFGEKWAAENNIPVELFPADWSQGKGAGYRRNEEMASKADALVCCWDGKSKGSKHMIDIAKRVGLKVFVHEFNPEIYSLRLLPYWSKVTIKSGETLEKWVAGYHCPACNKRGQWRTGVYFDHMMRCFNGCDPAPIWIPGETYLKYVKKL